MRPVSYEVSFIETRETLRQAITDYYKVRKGKSILTRYQRYRQRVVVYVDDIYKCGTFSPEAAELAHYLLDLYNIGYISTIYSISDYQGVSVLKSCREYYK